MKKKIISLFTLGLLLASCGGTDEKVQIEEKTTIKNCLYSYNPTQSELTFTAYKFLKKAGVSGTFRTIQVDGPETAGDAKSLVEQLSFKIPTASIETNDPGRNKKIDSLFFGTLIDTDYISGKVISLSENNKATLEITMNAISKQVEGNYSLTENKFSFDTEIDVNNWQAKEGLTALNNACKDLHTDIQNGDTESKLWPDVTISFSTNLREVCD
jgi:polyisoprenoid-binding protein YceI